MPIYEAATIDEAVQLGLADLGLAKDQVEIEILEEGKKRFPRNGSKECTAFDPAKYQRKSF
ncbi:hypothetical protein EfmGK923_27930 [Enterococcus faecium]|nr:hypothetical protein EfmGK923_27930 [Enterococcus faecium]